MPDLDCMPQWAVRIDREARTPEHAGVPLSGEAQRGLRIARQHREKLLQAIAPINEHRRELPEERPDFVAQREDPRGEKVRERLRDVREPQHVRDVARAFYGKEKARRRIAVPLLVILRTLQRVERAVDLDGGEMPAAELELAPLRQAFGVPD